MKETRWSALMGLLGEAQNSLKKRQHLSIHSSHEDPVQVLFNAVCPSSYIRPHRHVLDPKSEFLFVVRGAVALLLFDDAGAIRSVTYLCAGARNQLLGSACVEIEASDWHTIVALERETIVLECKGGPFNLSAAKQLARWAPEEGTLEGSAFQRRLLEDAKARLHFAILDDK